MGLSLWKTNYRPAENHGARLAFLDGIRGMAALYVALYHAAGDSPPPAPALKMLAWFLQFGHYAVGIFIVLSGYCLMLPVARSVEGTLPGGLYGYASRRMRRILPSYYVVLLLAVTAVALLRSGHATASAEEASVLRLTPGTLVSHLLLIHNLREPWAQAFDPPMWSVAAEWQIYLLFPLVLLPTWRYLGSMTAIGCGFALGLAPHFLLPPRSNLDWTFPWYVGLFTLGMAGASLTNSHRPREVHWRACLPWEWIAVLLASAFAVVVGLHPDLPVGQMWIPDTLLGCAVAAFLVACAGTMPRTGGQSKAPGRCVASLLELRPLVRLGKFSYSLYLLHAPVLWGFYGVSSFLMLDENAAFLLRLVVGIPITLVLSYAFFMVVERRFLDSLGG